MMKSKKGEAPIVMVLLVIGAVIVGMLAYNQYIAKPASVGGVPVQPGTSTTTQGGATVCQQQTDGTNTIGFAIKNALSSTLDYNANNIYFVAADGSILTNQTSNSGTQLNYATANVIPCATGTMYVIGDTNSASTSASFDTMSMNKNFVVQGGDAGSLLALPRTTAFATESSSAVNGSGDTQTAAAITSYVTNTTVAQGGTKEGFIDFSVNVSNAAYGYMVNGAPAADGVVFSVDLQNNNIYSTSSGFALNSQTGGVVVTKIACPSEIAATDNADVCFQTRTLTSGDGNIRLSYLIRADLGNPTSALTDDPILRTRDKAIFQDNDGTIKTAFISSSGTDQGQQTTTVQWVLA